MVDIIVSNVKEPEQLEFAEELYEALQQKGVEVVLDDRTDRFGPKIKDFELIGYPVGVIVGKGLKEGKVQLVDRKSLEKRDVSKEEALQEILQMLT